MPRTGALLQLSREHHSSLVVARAARKAADSDDTATCLAAIKRIEAHWQMVLAAHFAQEEQLLQLAEDALNAECVIRVFAEHAELRMLACGHCELESAARLRRFGDLLAAHVRFEERVLFPKLQLHPCIASATVALTPSLQIADDREF